MRLTFLDPKEGRHPHHLEFEVVGEVIVRGEVMTWQWQSIRNSIKEAILRSDTNMWEIVYKNELVLYGTFKVE